MVSGLFDNHESAARTVRDLNSANIGETDISLVAHPSGDYDVDDNSTTSRAATGAGTGSSTGAVIGGGAGVLAGSACSPFLVWDRSSLPVGRRPWRPVRSWARLPGQRQAA